MRFSTSIFSAVLATAHFGPAVGATPKLNVDGSQVVELSDRRYLRDSSQFERMLASIPTCANQSNCLRVTSTPVDPNEVPSSCDDDKCYFKICMILDTTIGMDTTIGLNVDVDTANGVCTKVGAAVSHVCYKTDNNGPGVLVFTEPDYCTETDGKIEAKHETGLIKGEWCQIVAAGGAAEFAVKDGSGGCGTTATYDFDAFGTNPAFTGATCGQYTLNNKNGNGGCSGNPEECLWSFPAPSACPATTSTEAATTTTKAATTTTEAATTTTEAATTTTDLATTTTEAATTTTEATTTATDPATTTTEAATTTTEAATTTTEAATTTTEAATTTTDAATTTTEAATTTTTEAATTTTDAATTTTEAATTTTEAATTTTEAAATTTEAATTTTDAATTTTDAATTTTEADTTTTTPGSGGDPHFQTFGNTFFDFHGGCDLVLGSMPSFAKGLGLLVQLRTTTRYDYSFIESVAIKIGEDILEISSFGQYMLNGISNAVTPFMISGYPVVYTEPRDNQHRFTIELGDNMNINVKVFKDLVYVSMDVAQGSDADFSDTVGLMGSWKTGARVARDGVTVLEDPIEFGQEWQVQSEANLFMTARAPQYPVKCEMPDPVERSSRRRLGESITAEAADIACSHVKGDHAHDMCIFDVIATNDLTVGQGGAY